MLEKTCPLGNLAIVPLRLLDNRPNWFGQENSVGLRSVRSKWSNMILLEVPLKSGRIKSCKQGNWEHMGPTPPKEIMWEPPSRNPSGPREKIAGVGSGKMGGRTNLRSEFGPRSGPVRPVRNGGPRNPVRNKFRVRSWAPPTKVQREKVLGKGKNSVSKKSNVPVFKSLVRLCVRKPSFEGPSLVEK